MDTTNDTLTHSKINSILNFVHFVPFHFKPFFFYKMQLAKSTYKKQIASLFSLCYVLGFIHSNFSFLNIIYIHKKYVIDVYPI